MLKKFFLIKNFQKEFLRINYKKKTFSILRKILAENSHVITSLGKNYSYNFKKKKLIKFKKTLNYRVIGMGGSILGAQAIYEFLKHKIKKNFLFINNLQNILKKEKKDFTNLSFQLS